MKPEKSIRDQVDRFLQAVHLHDGVDAPRGGCVWATRKRLIVLDAEQHEAFNSIVALLRDYFGAAGEWSTNAVGENLRLAIIALTDPEPPDPKLRRKKALEELFAAMKRQCVPWGAYFPVVGINQDCLPLEVGKVVLHPSSDALSKLLVLSDDQPSSTYPEELRLKFRGSVRKQIDTHFGASAWAHVRVKAAEGDSEAAHDLGIEELRLTLDVLNFYADIWRPSDYRSRVALASEPDRTVLHSMVVVEGSEPMGVGEENHGPVDDVWIPALDSDDARELALDRVSSILAKEATERSQVDDRLLAGLRWAGRATATRRPDEAFLLFMMAIEAIIMGPNNRDSILYKLLLRVAQVLNLPDAKDKNLLRDHLTRLYDLRSRLVHSGLADINGADVESARSAAKALTVELLKNATFARMKSNKDLDNWFESRIMGISTE